MFNNRLKTVETKSVKQVVFALRGDKAIQQMVFNIRLRFGIIDRPFTKDDFLLICEDENIRFIDDLPMPINGIYFICNGKKGIVVSQKLKGKDFLFVAFHESGHHFLHNPRVNIYTYSNQPTLKYHVREAQADYFAELAMGVKYER